MSQFALPLDWPADERDDAFIVTPSNAAAARHLERPGLWPVQAAILTGPRKSGRSLLGRIFARRTGGRLVDDAEDADEEALFHAWNAAQATRRPLLIVADEAPPRWAPRLPDLASRLAATPVVRVEAPDERLLAALADALLARRGIVLPPEVARWLVPRIERTHLALIRAVDLIDAAMLERRHRPTVPLARAALEAAGMIEPSPVIDRQSRAG